MLEKMTREDPLPCVDDFTHILEVVTPLLVNQNVFYKKSCASFIASYLVGLVFEDRSHEAYMFLNKLIKHKVCQPATLMYNTVIIALCDNPDKTMMDDALKLYQEMVSLPDVVTYNSLVSGLCKIRRWAKAYFLLKELLDKDISPDVETFNILINTICCQGRLQVAAHVIYMMHQRGISPNIATYNSLIYAHCVNGEMDKARSLVNHMVSNHHLAPDTATYTSFKPNCVTYNRMIQSCFSAERFEDAHKLLDDVLAQGQTLYTNTYCDIFYNDLVENNTCSRPSSLYRFTGEDSKEGLINDAKQFLEMEESHCWPTTDTYNYLLRAYLKNKCYDDGKGVLYKK
ncbi:putative pentatricopeptide repeat-containing protein [Tanacetum coccineum]